MQGSTDVVSLLKESQQVHQTLSTHELQQLLSVNVKVQDLYFLFYFLFTLSSHELQQLLSVNVEVI
jgi:hypothetical protein